MIKKGTASRGRGGKTPHAASLSSRGARHQFAIGIGLVSAIPLLGFAMLMMKPVVGMWDMISLCVIVLLGISGFAVLRRYPRSVIKLRHYVEHIVAGELPDAIHLPPGEDDIVAIERCMNVIVNNLREKLEAAENENMLLMSQLYHAEKMQSLGLMAGGIAHDFGNMMNVIQGSCELALGAFHDRPKLLGHIRDAQAAVRQATDLTRQMLLFAGKGEVDLTAVDLTATVSDMAGLIQSAVRSGVDVRYELSQGTTVPAADATQIRQVIMNLVINASDALPESGGRITVSTGSGDYSAAQLAEMHPRDNVVPGKYADIEVADTGHGITEDSLRRMFEPFYTTKTTGRGLGLAVVLGIVGKHRGLIGVSSVLKQGTVFRVLFPCAEMPKTLVTPDDVPEATAETELAGTASTPAHAAVRALPRMRAFVIEDRQDVRDCILHMLESHGLEVFAFEDAKDFCPSDTCKHRSNGHHACGDLVISDIRMPGMDGLTLAERQAAKGCLIPNMALMSGQWTKSDKARAKELNLAILHKPIDWAILDNWLKTCEANIDPDRALSDDLGGTPLPRATRTKKRQPGAADGAVRDAVPT